MIHYLYLLWLSISLSINHISFDNIQVLSLDKIQTWECFQTSKNIYILFGLINVLFMCADTEVEFTLCIVMGDCPDRVCNYVFFKSRECYIQTWWLYACAGRPCKCGCSTWIFNISTFRTPRRRTVSITSAHCAHSINDSDSLLSLLS